jgi:hypothetical protein
VTSTYSPNPKNNTDTKAGNIEYMALYWRVRFLLVVVVQRQPPRQIKPGPSWGRGTDRITRVVMSDRKTAAYPSQAFTAAYYSHVVER